MRFILKIVFAILVNAFALYTASYFIDGFLLSGSWSGLFVLALIFTLLNFFLRPILKLVLGPLLLLTLGLGIVIVNILVLYILDIISNEITIHGYMPLFWGTLLIGVVNGLFHILHKKKG